MGITNPSFETALADGTASGWTTVIVAVGAKIANFSGGSGAHRSVESFGVGWPPASGWSTELSGVSTSIFDVGIAQTPSFVESFHFWAGNKQWSPVLVNALAASFAPSSATIESFDPGGWAATITPASSFSESFDPGTWAATITPAATAHYTHGANTIESFGPHQADIAFVPVLTTYDTFRAIDPKTYAPVNVPNLAGVALTISTMGVRPGGILQGVTYYQISPSGSTFKLSLSPGGTAITFGDPGSGVHSLHVDETLYWTH